MSKSTRGDPKTSLRFHTGETRSASFSAVSRCRWRRRSVKQRSPDVSVFGCVLRLLQGRPDRLLSAPDKLETYSILLSEYIAALFLKGTVLSKIPISALLSSVSMESLVLFSIQITGLEFHRVHWFWLILDVCHIYIFFF